MINNSINSINKW